MTILTTESAKIIEGRCPDCTDAFRRKGDEYNKSIGYEPEKLSDLGIHSLACNAGFGLEYLLLGVDLGSDFATRRKKNQKLVELLRDGVMFCDYIKKSEKSETIQRNLQKIIANVESIITEEDKGYFKEEPAKKMLYARFPNISEQEVRDVQQFFNEESDPFLRNAIKLRSRTIRGLKA